MGKTALLVFFASMVSSGLPARASAVEPWPPIELTELVLKDSKLVEYLHLEVPGRQPVLVSRLLCHPDLETLKLGYSLKVVEPGSPEAARALQFTSVEVDKALAVLEVSYPVEGIRARFEFVRNGGRWTLKNRKLWEH